jgi:crotonobetainyl-CoA:carnitine CoA-transferase CaiB-like acyl-CoA transferase
LPAAHNLLTALTGIATGQPSYSGAPVHLVAPQGYYGQANCLATAIAAALLERGRSGRGQSVVVSGLHGAAQVMPSTQFGQQRAATIWGAPLGGAPNYRLYQCADGEWFFLGALFEPIYLRALDVTGVLAEVLAEPEIDGDLQNALVPPGALLTKAKLEAAFLTRPRAEWLSLLAAADVPCGPVNTREDWFAGETIAANGMRVELEHPDYGVVRMPGVSLDMSATPAIAPRLATTLPVEEIPSHRAASAPDAHAPDQPPLAGVKVLDLGVVIAGAYAGALLAGLGADVVKIETEAGDPFRSYRTGFSPYNRGKRSLVLDLKRPEGKELFFELVAQADVVLDNYRLGVRERLGITYEALRAVNPRIVSLSISGYGRTGPQAGEPGFDPLLQAQSGLMHAQGADGDEPVFYRIAVNDVGSAAMAALGIVAALFARTRTGEGQEIHTSLASQSVLLQIGELTSYPGSPPPPMGARDCVGTSALERYYECADGWIAIACTTPTSAAALMQELGVPASAPEIADALRPLPLDDALTRLEQAGVPAVPVLTIDDTYTDAFLAENGFYESWDDPEFGAAHGVASPARFSRTPTGYGRPAPMAGQHTTEVLHGFGVTQERIEALLESGVVR